VLPATLERDRLSRPGAEDPRASSVAARQSEARRGAKVAQCPAAPYSTWVAPAAISLATLALYATAQAEGEQWWSDAPRHALNGASILDLLRAMPLHDPKAWAVDYYLQYPALTILLYPPLFPVLEAILFFAFGVSTRVALLAIAAMLDHYGVRYVVAERDFRTDLQEMALLQDALQSDQFEQVTAIPVEANVPHPDHELRIFRNRHSLSEQPAHVSLEERTVGRTFSGNVISERRLI
jgi:hypothetical protein